MKEPPRRRPQLPAAPPGASPAPAELSAAAFSPSSCNTSAALTCLFFPLILNFLFIFSSSFVCLLFFFVRKVGFLVRLVLPGSRRCVQCSRDISRVGAHRYLSRTRRWEMLREGGTVRPSQVVGAAHGKCLCWRRCTPDGSSPRCWLEKSVQGLCFLVFIQRPSGQALTHQLGQVAAL